MRRIEKNKFLISFKYKTEKVGIVEFCIPKMKEGFMPIDKTEYNPTIDVMNIAACIAVVALHVNGGIWSFTRNLNWAIMLITECVCYWAVPVFFL